MDFKKINIVLDMITVNKNTNTWFIDNNLRRRISEYHKEGYVFNPSVTQAQWTAKGIKECEAQIRIENAKTFSEISELIMKDKSISFGSIFRQTSNWFCITSDENEKNVVDAVLELYIQGEFDSKLD